ncbi:hypothetical protein [Streptomyces sp. NPDC001809]
MARAVDLPETARALERYRRRAVEQTVAGAVVTALALGVGALLPGDWASDAAAMLGGLGALSLLGGLGAGRVARRMRRVLHAGPWSAHAAVPVERAWSSATVVLGAPGRDEAWPLAVVALRHRYDRVRPGPRGVLWWCGDPRTGGVLAPPGGGELIWAKPVRGRGGRLRVVRRAERAGLRDRPAPAQPQGPWGSQGPGWPQEPGWPRERRRSTGVRRRGVWRWVVGAAAVAFALGVLGTEASEGDPQVDLTVLGERSDGRCTVAWRDPFDGGRRTGPFGCTPDLDPVLAGWDTGFVVSYGPWKGDLYNADLEGTPAGKVNEVLGIGGALGVLVGLAGGGISRWRRRSADPHPAPGPVADGRPLAAPGPTADGGLLAKHRPAGTAAPGPSYARLVAHAERDHLEPAPVPRPEPDVRAVAWWRVRGLRRVSGLSEVLVGVAACLGMGAVVLAGPEGFAELQSRVMGVLVLGGAVVSAHRFRTLGRPAALLLARAAQAPVPVPRRYVLLHDPYGGAPVLAVFPVGDGQDDEPEALLVLASPGTRRRPWAGLPAAPAGEVELRGWLDRAEGGAPLVVPRVGDRVLWPAGPYLEAGTTDFAELLGRLGASVVTPPPAAPRTP